MPFHNSPNGPRNCKANPKNPNARGCPYALAGHAHYDTWEEANAAYNETMQTQFGGIEKMKIRKVEKVRQDYYKVTDGAKQKYKLAEAKVKDVQDTAIIASMLATDQVKKKATGFISKLKAKLQQYRVDADVYAERLNNMRIETAEAAQKYRIERLNARATAMAQKAEAIRNGTYIPAATRAKAAVVDAAKVTYDEAKYMVTRAREVVGRGTRRIGDRVISGTKTAPNLAAGDETSLGTVVYSTPHSNGTTTIEMISPDGKLETYKVNSQLTVETQRGAKQYTNQIRTVATKKASQVKAKAASVIAGVSASYKRRLAPFQAAKEAYKNAKVVGSTPASQESRQKLEKTMALSSMRAMSETRKQKMKESHQELAY